MESPPASPPPADAAVDVGAAEEAPTEPGLREVGGAAEGEALSSEDGLLDMFKDAVDAGSEYDYLDQPDPDRKNVEREYPGSKLVAAVLFFTRGHAVPWVPLLGVTLYAAFIITISWVASRNWDQNTPENCKSRWWVCIRCSLCSSVE